MNKQILIYGLISVLFLSLTSCKKYDDGPAFSLRSKKERIANDWRVEKAIDNGNDVTSDFSRYEVSFSKNGAASLTANYSFLGVHYEYTTAGTWSFESDKDKIKVDYENDIADAEYLILRLKEKELWVRQEGTDLELQLVPN